MEDVWYISPREGTDIGPFNSQVGASNSLQDFLRFIQLANLTGIPSNPQLQEAAGLL